MIGEGEAPADDRLGAAQDYRPSIKKDSNYILQFFLSYDVFIRWKKK